MMVITPPLRPRWRPASSPGASLACRFGTDSSAPGNSFHLTAPTKRLGPWQAAKAAEAFAAAQFARCGRDVCVKSGAHQADCDRFAMCDRPTPKGRSRAASTGAGAQPVIRQEGRLPLSACPQRHGRDDRWVLMPIRITCRAN
jgi:hypothetical protein